MEDEALIATETQTVSVAHVRHGVTADVIRVVDVRGNRATMLRVWRASVPYVVRGQSEKLLCSTSDKAFRAAITSSLTDDTFITNLNGDFDMQAWPLGLARARGCSSDSPVPLGAGRALLHRGDTCRSFLPQGCRGGGRALIVGSGAAYSLTSMSRATPPMTLRAIAAAEPGARGGHRTQEW